MFVHVHILATMLKNIMSIYMYIYIKLTLLWAEYKKYIDGGLKKTIYYTLSLLSLLCSLFFSLFGLSVGRTVPPAAVRVMVAVVVAVVEVVVVCLEDGLVGRPRARRYEAQDGPRALYGLHQTVEHQVLVHNKPFFKKNKKKRSGPKI